MKTPQARLLIVLAIVVVVATALVANAMFATPAPTTDYVGVLNAYKEANEPEGEAAWPLYRDAIDRWILPGGVSGSFTSAGHQLEKLAGIEGLMSAPLDDPRLAEALALIDTLAPVLDAMEVAATKPRMGKPYVRVGDALRGEQDPEAIVPLYEILLPELAPMRRVARLNEFAMRVAAEEGDWELFERRAVGGIGLAKHALAPGALIDHLVGLSITAVVLSEIRSEIIGREMPPALTRHLDAALEVDVLASMQHAHEIEWMFLYSMLEYIYDPRGELVVSELRGIDNFGPSGMKSRTLLDRLKNIVTYTYPRYNRTKDDLALYSQEFRVCIDSAERDGFSNSESALGESETTNRVLRPLLPVMTRAARNAFRLERDLRATRLMLQLEAIHAETGAFPAAIDTDRFADVVTDPLTGAPFLYEPSVDGAAYTLMAPSAPWDLIGDEVFTVKD